jgi:IclR family transcriptional regulator, pca regulon regulatory protein
VTDADRLASARVDRGIGTDFVQSLERGLAVIRAFDAEHPELTLSEVARVAGLTRASARRFLRTLAELGYVRSNGRLFALRPRVLELGYAYLSSLSLHEVAQPHLERLVSLLRESSSVSVLDADDVVYVARVPTRRIMTITISVGTRFPAYATSMGRVLLAGQSDEWLDGYFATVELRRLTARTVTDAPALRAELLQVREQGWAFVDEELEEGLRAIAAPINDVSGRVIAAVNVSSPVSRGSADLVRSEFLPHLLAAARGIEEDLSRRGAQTSTRLGA